MTDEQIIGKKIIDIYETAPSITEGILGMGMAHYFSIVIELDDYTRFELGIHKISRWESGEKLTSSKGTDWAREHKLEYKDRKILKIIRRDPNEYYDGSLTVVLEDDVLIEHQCFNGDQLFINRFEENA